jgi:SAM-dependent methyltransferase
MSIATTCKTDATVRARPSRRLSLRALLGGLKMRLADHVARLQALPIEVPTRPGENLEGILRTRALKSAREFRSHFIKLCQLRRDESVLDVGSGEGGIAIQLTKYLSRKGRYEGLDIRRHHVEACKLIVTPRYPNFRFRAVNVRNRHYNPKGRIKASEYRFPYDDESFDFVCLISVFTHMPIEEIDNYLREISRVLRTGGRCLITYYLINPESSQHVAAGKARKFFGKDFGSFRSSRSDVVERAIALDEEVVRALHAKHGLSIREPIRYGGWCGRRTYLSRQDIVIADKK